MSRYFTIMAIGLTDEQEKQLGKIWSEYPWWHWIANYWLLKDIGGNLTAPILRDQIKEIAPNAMTMIMEAKPTNWAGAFPSDKRREWLRNHWPPEAE